MKRAVGSRKLYLYYLFSVVTRDHWLALANALVLVGFSKRSRRKALVFSLGLFEEMVELLRSRVCRL